MDITVLVENTSHRALEPWPGLSLYIETRKHRLLFDVGENEILFRNAERLSVDLKTIDTVVISHGHRDHGGALGEFLNQNQKARIYVQETAFEPYYVRKKDGLELSCLDPELKHHPQVILIQGDRRIDEELSVFTVPGPRKYILPTNDTLYSARGKDSFCHEQNLVITEEKTVLFTGCGHKGIINILEKARAWRPDLCVGGFHLYNPTTQVTAPESFLGETVREMGKYRGMRFYTCHCTGQKAYEYLSEHLEEVHYLSCGDQLRTG